MFEGILVRYGDLTLKGKNQKYFIRAVNELLLEKLAGLDVIFDLKHDRAYIYLQDVPYEKVVERLHYVTGVYSFSLISKCAKDLDEISQIAIKMIEMETKKVVTSFKVETKRADKNFPSTSMEISRKISVLILRQAPFLTVDVHNPEFTLNVEIRQEAAYIYTHQIKGLGGYPTPMGGKALVLLSGGIDSPVATFLAIKKGLQVECIHFESTPMTPIESAQKVIDLVKVLSKYALHNQIKVHFVPFTKIHESILQYIPEPYTITIMRRMMIRIATHLKNRRDADAIITGDSIGQVASQTLESMSCITEVTNSLIIRPLATYDKLDIMNIARNIGTLDISNRPFSDCCTIYVPISPAIRPQTKTARRYEEAFDYETLVNEAVANTVMLTVHSDDEIDLASKGFTIKEVLG
ncbi:MAG: tRNA 4-thiouridine(8) synthase ThiI [Candidatus Izemoplasmatales bacterium]|jgi:thiamine biosynthesis protein ThiI|nr:tRNA 4-thiouridine(8) synthase ThiI [Candidatus Izemoplasmatales bacterium]